MSDENRVKLQELIDKCIDIGVILWGYKVLKVTITGHGTIIVYYKLEEPMIGPVERNIHDLFSKDSGIMEFVEWRNMSRQHAYIVMSQKTAEEKLQYFLDNAVLPQ